MEPSATTPANDTSVDRCLPPHLPREPQVHRPEATPELRDAQGQPCGCRECGGRLREIGRDVSEELEYVPGRFKVVRQQPLSGAFPPTPTQETGTVVPGAA